MFSGWVISEIDVNWWVVLFINLELCVYWFGEGVMCRFFNCVDFGDCYMIFSL